MVGYMYVDSEKTCTYNAGYCFPTPTMEGVVKTGSPIGLLLAHMISSSKDQFEVLRPKHRNYVVSNSPSPNSTH